MGPDADPSEWCDSFLARVYEEVTGKHTALADSPNTLPCPRIDSSEDGVVIRFAFYEDGERINRRKYETTKGKIVQEATGRENIRVGE